MDRYRIAWTRCRKAVWLVAMLVGTAVTLLTVLLRSRFASVLPDRDQQSFAQEATFEGGTSPSIEIPLALLSKYYEHGLEHTPPRDPSGAMQRREAYYRAPPDPLELIGSRLPGSADSGVRLELKQWQGIWLAGRPIEPGTVRALEQAARHSTLDALTLMEAGRAFGFLEGDELAAAFFRAAFAKAAGEYAASRPGDPAGLPLLRELDQTAALWRLKDYPALEMRFGLVRRLAPPLSVQSRRAGCLLVDALFYQDRFDEAADLILAVQKEHRHAGDLGALERSDLYEMEYLQGYVLFCAGRFQAAIPHLKRVHGGGEHDQAAAKALFAALVQSSRFKEAQDCYLDIVNRFKVPLPACQVMQRELEQAKLRRQWQQQMAAIN